MLPTSSSSRKATRPKLNGHRSSVTRSKSLFGAIKNIVTAPLTWFASNDDFEDSSGKRRRTGQPNPDPAQTEDGPSQSKRMRIHSPDRSMAYLDPPTNVFQPRQQTQPQFNFSSSSTSNNSISSTLPPTSLNQPANNRHTLSPARTQLHGLTRTMSIDPPSHYQGLSRDATMEYIPSSPLRRDYPMELSRASLSGSRVLSMPPLPTQGSFRMRTSLTPQPSSSSIGPSAIRRDRDASEPPPLTSLMSNPIFVRAPPEPPKLVSGPSTSTLGSLVEAQRNTRSPVRQHSSLLFNSQTAYTLAGEWTVLDQFVNAQSAEAPVYTINPAEKALHELDVYKTPLLPTRLRGSAGIPDLFKPRKSQPLILMNERDRKSRLGNKGKDKDEQVNGTKPYAGEGGMKKLLARRKMEQAEEKEEEEKLERAAAMDDVRNDDAGKPPAEVLQELEESNRSQEPRVPPLVPPASDWPKAAFPREESSLRVGRAKISRQHISRPVARTAKNRFSAAYEDDDQMDEEKSQDQIELEEAAKKAPMFTIPAGFSFAKEVASIQHDPTNAKEPPISSLPFSFTASTSTSTSAPPQLAKTTLSTLEQPSYRKETRDSLPVSVFKPAPSEAAPVPEPTVSYSEPVNSPHSVATKASIPNFFANSAFTKTASVTSTPLPSLVETSNTAEKDHENPFWQGGNQEKQDVGVGTLFGGSDKEASQAPNSIFVLEGSGNVASIGSATSTTAFALPTPPAASSFADPSPTPAPGKENEPTVPSFLSALGNKTEGKHDAFFFSPQPPQLPQSQAFPSPTLGQPALVTNATKQQQEEEPKESTSIFGGALMSFNGGEALKSFTANDAPKPFSFGPSASSSQTPVVEAPKSSFGGFSFGAAPAEPTMNKAISSSTTSAFSFGASPAAPASVSTENALSSTSAFALGAAPSTPPANTDTVPPAFSFSAPTSIAAPSTDFFGMSSGNGNNGTSADSQKPFSMFGANPLARPVTPPRNPDQEIRMEESPTRDMQPSNSSNNIIDKQESRPTLGFTFGVSNASTGSIFGQNSSSGSASTVPAPFSFGTSNANPFGAKPEAKPEEKQATSFSGFGQPQPSSSSLFSFGQKPAVQEAPRPSTTGSFSFQSTPSTSTGPSFAFGGPSSSNAFGSQSGSAPSSPSTFQQPSPFSFAPPAAAASASFTFGASQPASPASATATLPPGGGFGTSFGGSQSSSSFGTAPATPGGTLFTIGAAPAAAAAPGRQIRKLPNRRPAKR